jgi:two-component system, LytTR family, response regulator
MDQVRIRTSKGTIMMTPENIIRVQASSEYSVIYFNNEYPLTVAKVLRWFEEKLPKNIFYRIHHSHIVNSQFISEIHNDSTLLLVTGEEFQISRRKRKACQALGEGRKAEREVRSAGCGVRENRA